MATVANELIASTMPAGETTNLFLNGASDAKLLHQLDTGQFGTIAMKVAGSILVHRRNFATCVAMFGRVDAGLVVASSDLVAWSRTDLTDVFAACILGIVVVDHVTGLKMVLNPDQVKLPLGVSRERAAHLQTLYRAQRAALAGGRPVSPALVAAAYPQVKVEPAHIAGYIAEMKQWESSKFARIDAVRAEYAKLYKAACADHDAAVAALQAELGAVKPVSVAETTQSGTIATQAEIDQIAAALADTTELAAAAVEPAAAAAVEPAATEPAAAAVEPAAIDRQAVKELIALLDKLARLLATA